jgi:hypothetical protein
LCKKEVRTGQLWLLLKHPTVPGSIHIESGSYGLHSFRVSVHTLKTDRLQCVGYPNPGFIYFSCLL